MRQQDTRLLAFLGRNCLAGVLTGWLIVGAMLYLDVAGLGGLVFGSEHWPLALLLMAGGFGVTFGSLAMSTAIFLLPKE